MKFLRTGLLVICRRRNVAARLVISLFVSVYERYLWIRLCGVEVFSSAVRTLPHYSLLLRHEGI
jgi:predicted small integral membrane protein